MKLNCPKCDGENTKVISVDDRSDCKVFGSHIARYWRCLYCNEKYITREKIEDKLRKNTDNFKLNNHQVQQIGFNRYGLSQLEWAEIYEVSQTTIQNAKKRFLRKNL